MPFTSHLDMRHKEGTEKYTLLIPLVYVDPEGNTWKLEAGTESDGHSIPKLLRSVGGSPFATKYPKSAWFHDEWCRTGIMSRRLADYKYKVMMKEEGANGFQQVRNYVGVRTGAFFNWISSPFRRRDAN